MNHAADNQTIESEPSALADNEAQAKTDAPTFLRRNFDLFLFALLVVGFAFIAAQGLVTVPVPETDEAYTLQVAYEVVHHNRIALPMYRYLGGNIENHWHSYTPVYFVLLGDFFKIFGWGIVEGRAFNLITALATLIIMYLIARRLFDWRAAMIAALLLISDQTFLERARLLRNDYAAAFFAMLAFYLFEIAEEKQRNWLYVASGLAAGAGVMCHTNILYMISAIGLLMLLRDGWRIFKSKKLYTFAVSAFLVMAYEVVSVLLDWQNFLQQNRGDKLHFQVLEGGGWFQNVWREQKRYLLWRAGGEMFLNVPRTLLHIFQLLTLIALIYLAIRFLLTLKNRAFLNDYRFRILLVTLVVMIFLAVLGGNKDIYYIAHLAPWFAICVGVMLRDGLQAIQNLKQEHSQEHKLLGHYSYQIGTAFVLIIFLLFGYQFLKQQRRYLREVRNPDLASFAEIKDALQDIVTDALCPVAMKAPEMWLAFPERDYCFATIEERTKQRFEEDPQAYALIMANASQRARSRWTKEFDEKYHLLGELKDTAYGDIKVYYTGKDERFLQIAPKQIQFFGNRRGHTFISGEKETEKEN